MPKHNTKILPLIAGIEMLHLPDPNQTLPEGGRLEDIKSIEFTVSVFYLTVNCDALKLTVVKNRKDIEERTPGRAKEIQSGSIRK